MSRWLKLSGFLKLEILLFSRLPILVVKIPRMIAINPSGCQIFLMQQEFVEGRKDQTLERHKD